MYVYMYVYISFYVANVMCISTFVQVLKMNGKTRELKYSNKNDVNDEYV